MTHTALLAGEGYEVSRIKRLHQEGLPRKYGYQSTGIHLEKDKTVIVFNGYCNILSRLNE